MDKYVTGAIIKRLREGRGMTQADLARQLFVSEKAISKWETGKGYPDISILEDLASALGISVIELFAGSDVSNQNRAFDMKRAVFYVCPVCGNVIASTGEAVVSCCGVTLPALEADEPDDEHSISIFTVEDEWFVRVEHPMDKRHFISFIAAVGEDGVDVRKLYPEGSAECRFPKRMIRYVYCYCNRDGLFRVKL